MRIMKEQDNRQLKELRGHLLNTESCPMFISHSFYISQSIKEGEGEKTIFLARYKEQINYFLNTQSIK